LKITDRRLLYASLERLRQSYKWRDEFVAANAQVWFSEDEVKSLRLNNGVTLPVVQFFPKKDVSSEIEDAPIAAVRLVAMTSTSEQTERYANFWVQANSTQLPAGVWYLFVHGVDAQGEILANLQAALIDHPSPTPERNIRYYRFRFSQLPPAATSFAFGFYKPEGNTQQFLMPDQGYSGPADTRVIVPIVP
jgi:hypothetical protein